MAKSFPKSSEKMGCGNEIMRCNQDGKVDADEKENPSVSLANLPRISFFLLVYKLLLIVLLI